MKVVLVLSALLQPDGSSDRPTASAIVDPPQQSSPVSAADYEEQWIGSWRLRTDRKARTFGVIWMDTGVIELSARTADGSVSWELRDNGALLQASLNTPRCALGTAQTNYPGASADNVLTGFAPLVLTSCPAGEHEATVRQWLSEFPAALEAMKSRAQALYKGRLKRCVEPAPPPGELPPFRHHPYCGFPPPEIGENHAD